MRMLRKQKNLAPGLRELVAKAKQWGAAGTHEFDFAKWVQSEIRPIVYLEYGEPGPDPELLAARREQLTAKYAEPPQPLAEERVHIAFSYPLTAVVLLTGLLTGVVLDLSGVILEPVHWAAVLITSLWLTAVLHWLPHGLRRLSRLGWALSLQWRRVRLAREISRLEKAEIRERLVTTQRERAITECTELLVKTYDAYRSAARAFATSQPSEVAA